MAKKTAGPKEAALRALMEEKAGGGAEAGNGLFDLETYQTELQKLKEKHLSGVKAKIQELSAQRRAIDEELNKLNVLEARIEGRAIHTGSAKPSGSRMSKEDKLEIANVIYGKMAASKLNKFSSRDLEQFTGGVKARELVEIWNEKHKDDKGKQIDFEGDKAARKYFVH